MVFDRTKLVHIGGVSPLPKEWEYFTTDNISAAGYFPKNEGIEAGDRVAMIDITKVGGVITGYVRSTYYIKENAGVLTAVALTDSTGEVSEQNVEVDTSSLTHITGSTLAEALASIDAKLS